MDKEESCEDDSIDPILTDLTFCATDILLYISFFPHFFLYLDK